MPDLSAYEPLVGASVIEELRTLASHLKGKRIVMVNSTRVGGGVAEILNRMMPLLTELGIPNRWEIIQGTDPYYRVTKAFHNALHGRQETITQQMLDLFLETGRMNAERMTLDEELVFIHDPQPITLVEQRKRFPNSHWIWRCHIDVSRPNQTVWNFLKPYIQQYEVGIYSAPAFVQKMDMRQVLVAPSIDPLSDKNRDLSKEEIDSVMERLGIPRDIPIVTQVSRFDYLKDPVGVVQAFRRARKWAKCRLVLAGGTATDDPEGEQVLAEVRAHAGKDPEIHLLLLPPNSDVEINALQRASAVVLQKSLREGFGLTVSEALWKARPLIASAVGGIPLQVKHGYNGLLVHSVEGCAQAIKQLINNPDYAERLAQNGREHVRQHFLLTRHIRDYLLLCTTMGTTSDMVSLENCSIPAA